tara:strand:+ start:3105 stop:4127 length:1023 start_codon:yes stop_codon:yes gene_type:complete
LAGNRGFKQQSYRSRQEQNPGMGFMSWFFIIVAILLLIVGFLFRNILFESGESPSRADSLLNEKKELQNEKEDLQSTIARLTTELESVREPLANELEADIARLEAELESVRSPLFNDDIKIENDNLKTKIKKLENEKWSLEDENLILKEEIKALEDSVTELENSSFEYTNLDRIKVIRLEEIQKLLEQQSGKRFDSKTLEELLMEPGDIGLDDDSSIGKKVTSKTSSNLDNTQGELEQPSGSQEDRNMSLAAEPKMTDRKSPKYPSRAIQRGYEGKVTLVFDVDTNGVARNIEIQSGANSSLNNEAKRALEKSKFRPALDEKGTPYYYVGLTYSYTFRLN